MSYLMMDLASLTVSEEEKTALIHPSVGGVILFARNYSSKSQLIQLIKSIRMLNSNLLIAVDQEGGRVQRFTDGFTIIPAMGKILPAANNDMQLATSWAKELGFLMAIEVLSCDIDLSFAPILDLNRVSQVIGHRSFSSEPEQVSLLAKAFIKGMNEAGMKAVGKHFPGHGSVEADSHIAMPVDDREINEIENLDLKPFSILIEENVLAGIMPAHVIYSKVDTNPAGFSKIWLQNILRQKLKFNGVIFSDDLGMKGASVAGEYCDRAKAALSAGCNMILLCNNPQGVREVQTNFNWAVDDSSPSPFELKPDLKQVAIALEDTERWLLAKEIANTINGVNCG